ncbi:uncharacterized protein LOC133931155 isoform X2 [Phragmites australis]|uniref:uncharacterized protein LOC133931155 isoform X2 n=1 Tax=Phragmites australis TaxID=29695 RepID=UPI002D78A959|nr:uncharacterized protein LOC133931155 isoform X2 [Phragmites australis]
MLVCSFNSILQLTPTGHSNQAAHPPGNQFNASFISSISIVNGMKEHTSESSCTRMTAGSMSYSSSECRPAPQPDPILRFASFSIGVLFFPDLILFAVNALDACFGIGFGNLIDVWNVFEITMLRRSRRRKLWCCSSLQTKGETKMRCLKVRGDLSR